MAWHPALSIDERRIMTLGAVRSHGLWFCREALPTRQWQTRTTDDFLVWCPSKDFQLWDSAITYSIIRFLDLNYLTEIKLKLFSVECREIVDHVCQYQKIIQYAPNSIRALLSTKTNVCSLSESHLKRCARKSASIVGNLNLSWASSLAIDTASPASLSLTICYPYTRSSQEGLQNWVLRWCVLAYGFKSS